MTRYLFFAVVGTASEPMYTLALETASDQVVNIAVEFENTGVEEYNILTNGDGYSSDNVVKGKGSVITICGRNSTLSPTLGCIDISSGDMSTLLSYLDADKNPHIQIK